MDLYQNQEIDDDDVIGDEGETQGITFEEYSEYKETCEAVVAEAEKAARLAENPDFKAIMMDAYFTKEPARLAGMMASGRLNDKQFDECVKDLRAIGSSRSFLQSHIERGNVAKDELANLEIAWNEATQEREDS